jgi:hypothetical protein
MTKLQILHILQNYKKLPAKSKIREQYLSEFQKKMIYRTTKTENPELTMKMVEKVLNKV